MDLIVCLDKALLPDPPLVLREGGFIRDGYNEELDELREISKKPKDTWLGCRRRNRLKPE